MFFTVCKTLSLFHPISFSETLRNIYRKYFLTTKPCVPFKKNLGTGSQILRYN